MIDPSAHVKVRGLNDDEIRAENRRCGLTLSPDEWRGLADRIGRDPTLPEAFLMDVSLSEHCSYKSSRPLLKKHLPPLASHVVLGPGEDAGIVSLGDWAGEEHVLVLAHESHNHPSQVLPVEGAATGIGGIVRDVYCMGSDVLGVLDPLRFGDPNGPHGAHVSAIARGVVQGIAEYGNALGVPNLGGDVYFDEGFDDNCLVNVVAFGVMRRSRIIRSRVPEAARKEPFALVLVGKPTDSTGLGGASFASQILDEEEAAQNRGSVQVHDPFLKRVLVEATKEIWKRIEAEDIPIGCKDLGAGGLGGASSELVLAGGFGAEIDLDKVPMGEPGLLPHQVLCGETQERFVWAVPERWVDEFCAVFNRDYELSKVYPNARAAVIGRVIEERVYRCKWNGEVVVELSHAILEDSPIAERQIAERTDPAPVRDPEAPGNSAAAWQAWAEELLARPNRASRAPIYRGYDQEVQGHAYLRPGEADAGVLRPLSGESLGLAISVDGNPDYGRLDPYWGGALSVFEAARNVVATGAVPIAITDCLNFGNPEIPVALGDMASALEGMRDACVAIGSPDHSDEPLPIVSGNVSLYNQSSRGRAIAPSPIVACFGTLRDYSKALTQRLRAPGSELWMLGARGRHWGRPGVEKGGRVPSLPLAEQTAQLRAAMAAIERGLVLSAHDISDGGLLSALFEMAVREDGPEGHGVEIDLATSTARSISTDPTYTGQSPAEAAPLAPHELLLSETPGFVFESPPGSSDAWTELAAEFEVQLVSLGKVTADPNLIVKMGGAEIARLDLAGLHRSWSLGLAPIFLAETAGSPASTGPEGGAR
ncbi:MAG: phosphoribosylformylglycinamidine synthase subunit PurL [Candidatus Eisenbacteria bacterium]|nr:phosphoribosylformylglycinamidine synthase subunit PurL [Candidatus Eisenbacteria bacterium]